MKIDDALVCPKCNKKFLRPAIPSKAGFEYFCHNCHLYFDILNLINFWDWDAGNFYPDKLFLEEVDVCEPKWNSKWERMESYEVVERMLVGIPEWYDGCSNEGIDTGATHP